MTAKTQKDRVVTLIPGDGIGPEITAVVQHVFKAADVPIAWDIRPAGFCAIGEYQSPLPEKTIASIQKNGVCLKGPCTTPVGEGFRSINVELRRRLDLYANIREAKSLPGVKSRYDDIDLVVIRENTEGLYCGEEYWVNEGKTAAKSVALVTQKASERIIRYAFEYALSHRRKKITLVHKANILKYTGGLFLETGRKIAKEYAQKYKRQIEFQDKIIDNVCMQLVVNPYQFEVLVATNLFGDILSDLTAGLIGGLGLAPAANIGEKGALFEAVHGSAPDIAGENKANPTALLLSSIMMLEYLNLHSYAKKIRTTLLSVLKKGKTLTADLGGKATTTEFQNAIIASLK